MQGDTSPLEIVKRILPPAKHLFRVFYLPLQKSVFTYGGHIGGAKQ